MRHDHVGVHRANFVKHLEAEGDAVELDRKTPVRIIHNVDFLAHQSARLRCRIQYEHHPVIMQGEVVRDRPLLPPGQNLVQIIRRCQLSVQILGIHWLAAKSGVVIGDDARQPCVRRRNRGNPGQPQLLDQPILQRAERALYTSLRLRRICADDVDVQLR